MVAPVTYLVEQCAQIRAQLADGNGLEITLLRDLK